MDVVCAKYPASARRPASVIPDTAEGPLLAWEFSRCVVASPVRTRRANIPPRKAVGGHHCFAGTEQTAGK